MHKDERVTDAMVELKPCPFCGGKARLFSNTRGYWGTCTNEDCDAETPGRTDATEAAAIWNRRAALASAEEEKAVKVKALEWVRPPLTNYSSRAETVVGSYRVWTHREAEGVWYGGLEDGVRRDVSEYHSEEAAKAAAQADYETRIRSALVDVPAVEQEPGDLAAYWVAVADVMSDLDIAIPRLGAGPRQKLADKARETAVFLAQSHPPRSALVASPEAGIQPSSEILTTIKEFARWHHLNETTIAAGKTPSDSEIDFEATAWNRITRALSRNSSTEETVGDAITAKGTSDARN